MKIIPEKFRHSNDTNGGDIGRHIARSSQLCPIAHRMMMKLPILVCAEKLEN